MNHPALHAKGKIRRQVSRDSSRASASASRAGSGPSDRLRAPEPGTLYTLSQHSGARATRGKTWTRVSPDPPAADPRRWASPAADPKALKARVAARLSGRSRLRAPVDGPVGGRLAQSRATAGVVEERHAPGGRVRGIRSSRPRTRAGTATSRPELPADDRAPYLYQHRRLRTPVDEDRGRDRAETTSTRCARTTRRAGARRGHRTDLRLVGHGARWRSPRSTPRPQVPTSRRGARPRDRAHGGDVVLGNAPIREAGTARSARRIAAPAPSRLNAPRCTLRFSLHPRPHPGRGRGRHPYHSRARPTRASRSQRGTRDPPYGAAGRPGRRLSSAARSAAAGRRRPAARDKICSPGVARRPAARAARGRGPVGLTPSPGTAPQRATTFECMGLERGARRAR